MMSREFFNSLDYIYIAITFISGIVGFSRGFTKDFLSSCAWFGGAFLAIFIAPYLAPRVAVYIGNPTLVRCVAILIAYIIVLITLLLTINLISQHVKRTLFVGLDRALGVLFGILRGIGILVCACILFLLFGFQQHKYRFIQRSKLSPTLFDFSRSLMPRIIKKSFIPKTPHVSKVIKKKPSPKLEPPIVRPIKETQKDIQEKNIDSIMDAVADVLATHHTKKQEQPASNVPPPNLAARPKGNKKKRDIDHYGIMSLIDARRKRREEKKKIKLKQEILRKMEETKRQKQLQQFSRERAAKRKPQHKKALSHLH